MSAAEQLMHMSRRKNQDPVRDYAILRVLLHTALRVNEFVELQLSQYRGKHLVNISHLTAKRRSVLREIRHVGLSDESVQRLATSLIVGSSGQSERFLREELRQRVRSAIEQLPDEFREVLIMRRIEQMSVAEIGAAVGVPPGTVKSRVFRGLEKLQNMLSDVATGDER
jgi:RNA polymerase sigma factor (sigma-70 family)